jgi:hypothetical protein
MRRSPLLLISPCLAALLASLASTREARAGIFLGAEYDAVQGIDLPGVTRSGDGFRGTLGYRIGLGPIFLQPEAQGSYMLFPTDAGDHIHVARAMGGARLGLSGIFQPAIFGHAGVGWLDTFTDGRAFDAGISLAFKLIPVLSFGAQASYDVVTIASTGLATRWLSYGAHVAIEL